MHLEEEVPEDVRARCPPEQPEPCCCKRRPPQIVAFTMACFFATFGAKYDTMVFPHLQTAAAA